MNYKKKFFTLSFIFSLFFSFSLFANSSFRSISLSEFQKKITEYITKLNFLDSKNDPVDNKNNDEDLEIDASRSKKIVKNEISPFLYMTLENRTQNQINPFDKPQDNKIINRQASLEFGFKASDYFLLYVKSDVANVNYNLQAQNNQLDIQLNRQVNNLNVGFSLKF